MAESNKHDVDRRQFLKGVLLTTVGIGAGIAGINLKPGTSSKETPIADRSESGNVISEPEGDRENYWKGSVEEGEGLTGAVERISGKKIDNLSFKLIWEHDQVNYIFESKKAFMNQVIVPLPVVWPKDRVVLGSELQMKDDISELNKLPVQQRVYLEAKNNIRDTGVEMTLTVLGGRFDRPVIFKRNDEGTSWEVNPERDRWVDSDKLKEIMEENPDMKSSEAFPQLLN